MSRFTIPALFATTLATTLVSFATPAAADDGDLGAHASTAPGPAWRIDVARTTRWLASPGAAALATGTRTGVGLDVSRRVLVIAPPVGPAIAVAALVDVDTGGLDGTMFQRLSTSLGSADFSAGVRATAKLRYHTTVGARATVGATRASLRVSDMYMAGAVPIDDAGWGSVAALAATANFEPLISPHVNLGFSVDVGYVATSGVELHAYPSDRPDANHSIDTAYASIGHLDLQGWSMRIGMNASF